MRRWSLGRLLLLLSAAAILVAHGHAPAASRGTRDGGRLVRRLTSEVQTLNPVRATTLDERYVAYYLYTPLIHLDRNLQPTRGLATSWEISPDGRAYRFRLNPRATFSDGTPVRASDVVFTLRKIADPLSKAPQVYGLFEGLDLRLTRAVDAHTVEVVFNEPRANQLLRFNRVFVLPERVYGRGVFAQDFDRIAVGSGPYRLARTDGTTIVLDRRTDYWEAKPHIEIVMFKLLQEPHSAWNAVQRGDIDETAISGDLWARVRTDPAVARRVRFEQFYTLSYNLIAWNLRRPMLRDRRVRRALAMCVPTETIIKTVYAGTARAMTGPFVPGSYATNPAMRPIGYDLAGARRLLAAAGWIDRDRDGVLENAGVPLAFTLRVEATNTAATDLAQILQAEWRKVGVRVEVERADLSVHVAAMREGNFDATFFGREFAPEPDPYSLFHSSQFAPAGQNFGHYANAAADRLMEAARRETNQRKRQALYWRLHELLADDQPYLWVVQAQSKWALSRRVHGATASHGYGLFRWYPGEFAWWVTPTTPPERARR